MKRAAWLLLLLALAGCARGHTALLCIARANPNEMALLCKHCNCYMPADVDPNSTCAVCNCGYRAGKCYRGN